MIDSIQVDNLPSLQSFDRLTFTKGKSNLVSFVDAFVVERHEEKKKKKKRRGRKSHELTTSTVVKRPCKSIRRHIS